MHANIGLLLLQMDKGRGNVLFKYSRGKRIAQMCINETPPDLSNTSSSMAYIVNSYAFKGAENSSDSLTLLDLDTVIPNDKVVLTPTKYNDVQAIGHGHTLSKINTDDCIVSVPLHPPQSSSKPRKEPYYVQYLSHNFFKKFDTVQSYKTIRPGRSVGDAKVNWYSCTPVQPYRYYFLQIEIC